MDITSLSKQFSVRRLNQADVGMIYELSRENHIFYQYHPPFVTEESILSDMEALPPNKTPEDKYYIGFFDGHTLAAVMDLITHYPKERAAFIGFFMTDVTYQNKGIGSSIISEVISCLRALNFEKVQLGVDTGNPQSYAFWRKNNFVVVDTDKFILMELAL